MRPERDSMHVTVFRDPPEPPTSPTLNTTAPSPRTTPARSPRLHTRGALETPISSIYPAEPAELASRSNVSLNTGEPPQSNSTVVQSVALLPNRDLAACAIDRGRIRILGLVQDLSEYRRPARADSGAHRGDSGVAVMLREAEPRKEHSMVTQADPPAQTRARQGAGARGVAAGRSAAGRGGAV